MTLIVATAPLLLVGGMTAALVQRRPGAAVTFGGFALLILGATILVIATMH